MYKIVRTDEEIDHVLQKSGEGIDLGSYFTKLSYEEGIDAFAGWLFGDAKENPFPKE